MASFLACATQLPIFCPGPHNTKPLSVPASSPSKPPKPSFIVTPTEPGNYPVLQFHSGTEIPNCMYKHILTHVASHGYITVAPQLYLILPQLEEEVHSAEEVTAWLLNGGLKEDILPDDVEGDIKKLGVAGHSRGGNVAFHLALDYDKTPPSPLKALIGVAPVAGVIPWNEITPKILDHPFNLSMPVTVLGPGLDWLFASCDPAGVNYEAFYKNCQPPCGCFVAKDYGHMDMLDNGMIQNLCESAEGPKDKFKRFVGGIIVASLKAGFEHDFCDLLKIAHHPEVAPVCLSVHEYKRKYET